VKLHSVFLRSSCVLPHSLDPLREPFGENWTHVEEIAAPDLDRMIRQAGWHFIMVSGAFFRRGFARTQEEAIHRALARALKAVARRCNAAEFNSVQVTEFAGFHIANVIVQPRQIRQYTSLDVSDERHPQPEPAR
jgi:hypothetical protein